MNGFEMIQPVLVMATIVVLGYLVTLRVQVTGEVKQFIAFVVINFALPAVVVNSIFQAEFDAEMWRQLILVFLIGLMLNIVGVGTGYISGKLLKYTEEEARQLAVLAGLGNTGFIGIPLTVMIFGSEAGVFAAIYDATTVLTVFTLGIVLLQQGSFRFGQLKS
uniref:AEC family transporter n=1 Tax=Salsuginibacillus kocurii TaxID=427078 RepID=UPI00036FA519